MKNAHKKKKKKERTRNKQTNERTHVLLKLFISKFYLLLTPEQRAFTRSCPIGAATVTPGIDKSNQSNNQHIHPKPESANGEDAAKVSDRALTAIVWFSFLVC